MLGANQAVGAAELETAGKAVRHQEAVERVPGPLDRHRRVDQYRQRDVIDHEAGIDGEGFGKSRPIHAESADLVEELNLEERYRGNRPGPSVGQPGVLLELRRADQQPEDEMSIEEHVRLCGTAA